jgi:hypothetical protein
MISVERHNEGPKITVVTRGGTKIGVDMATRGNQTEQWVRKSAGLVAKFNPQQGKETYQSARKEILGPHGGASTSSMPHIEDRVILDKSSVHVNMLT